MHIATRFFISLALLASLVMVGCAKPQQPPLPTGNLTLGVAHFTHPTTNADMLAGYIGDEVENVDTKIFNYLDNTFAGTLIANSKHNFMSAEKSRSCSATIAEASNEPRAALRRWSEVGRCMGVDLLLVPQVYEWHARKGSSAGVTAPARVVLGFFLIDVRNETLVSRYHFEETQQALTSNLLEVGKFFKRSGRWITAEELAQEAMEQAVKELRL